MEKRQFFIKSVLCPLLVRLAQNRCSLIPLQNKPTTFKSLFHGLQVSTGLIKEPIVILCTKSGLSFKNYVFKVAVVAVVVVVVAVAVVVVVVVGNTHEQRPKGCDVRWTKQVYGLMNSTSGLHTMP
jgi:hypothetical protein